MTKTKTKITKQILCVMLCFVTAFYTLPMSAFAGTTVKYAKYTGLYNKTGYYYYYAYPSSYSKPRLQYISLAAIQSTASNRIDRDYRYYTCYPSPFSDLDAETTVRKYGNALWYLTVLNDFMEGKSSTNFCPNNYLTIGDALKTLYNMAGSPSVSKQVSFKYISSSSTYYKAAQWAYKNGITTDKSLSPCSVISREKLITFIYRFYISLDYPQSNYTSFSSSSKIKDYSTISSYAKKAVRWAYGNSFISLSSNGNFNPSGKITRINSAKVFYTFCCKFTGVLTTDATKCGHTSVKKYSLGSAEYQNVYVCKDCHVVCDAYYGKNYLKSNTSLNLSYCTYFHTKSTNKLKTVLTTSRNKWISLNSSGSCTYHSSAYTLT